MDINIIILYPNTMQVKTDAYYTLENFGLDPVKTKAFTLQGIWNMENPDILDFHGFHQVLVTLDGTILLYDAEYQYPLYRHVAAFIPAQSPHRVKTVRPNVDVNCESIFFNRNFFPFTNLNISIFEITELGGALINTLNEHTLTDINDGFLFNCVKLLVEVIQRDLNERPQQIRLPISNDRRVSVATHYIQKNFNNKITLKDLALSANLSTRQLSRVFYRTLRISPLEYVRIYRILNASVQLTNSNAKVIDIALSNGYDSISTFYRDFNKYFDISPDRFRKLSL